MKLNARQIQQAMQLLRNVAECDDNDVIANCASQLAWEFETVKLPFDTDTLNEKRQAVLKYAVSCREKYVLNPGKKHAEKVAI